MAETAGQDLILLKIRDEVSQKGKLVFEAEQ